jgi:preprotein translocase subunit YajC
VTIFTLPYHTEFVGNLRNPRIVPISFHSNGSFSLSLALLGLLCLTSISETWAHSDVPIRAFGLVAQTTDAAAPANPPPGAGGETGRWFTFIEQLFQSNILLVVGIFVLFYAIFIAPERRRRAEEAKLMAGLKKNDRIVTIGGIHGTIVNLADNEVVTIKVDESSGTRIRINRSAIARVIAEPTDATDKDDTNATNKS